jgi:hypothetical protein
LKKNKTTNAENGENKKKKKVSRLSKNKRVKVITKKLIKGGENLRRKLFFGQSLFQGLFFLSIERGCIVYNQYPVEEERDKREKE